MTAFKTSVTKKSDIMDRHYLEFGRKPCARVVFSPHGILKPPVLRQLKTLDARNELNLKFSVKHYLEMFKITQKVV